MAGPNTFGARDIYQVTVKEPPPEPELLAAAETPVPETASVDTVYPADTAAPVAPAEPQDVAPVVMASAAEVMPEQVADPVEEPAEKPAEAAETEMAEGPDAVTEELPATPVSHPAADAAARSYTIQIMALKRPVDLNRFGKMPGLTVAYKGDHWYRYTLGSTTEEQEASRILADLVAKGYKDAFIRRKSIIPMFTIQVMAVPGPVVDLSSFENLPEISARKGEDSFCRYTTGEFENLEDARDNLKMVQESGYPGAFVARIRTPQ
jgi:cell division septation protein DedD